MVSINNQGHVWKQSDWKMLRDELFIYTMTRRPLLPLQEDGNKDVTWAMLLSAVPWGRWGYPKRGIMDNRQQPCQSFMEKEVFEDEMRIWHSLIIIQHQTLDQILVKISLEVIVPVRLFWSFSPSLHSFVFAGMKHKTKPARHSNCSADDSLTHSMALSKQLAHLLSHLCLLKNRVMSYTLLIMKKWTWMELFPESKLLNKYALRSDPKTRICLWEQLHFHWGQSW